MKNNWSKKLISELCDEIIDCVNKTAPIVNYKTDYKMIRTTNVGNGFIDVETVRYVEEEIYIKWTRRGKPLKGDIILTREAPLGRVGLLRYNMNIFLGQRLVMYRVNKTVLNNKFLLYALLSHEVQGQIMGFGSGSTVEHMRVPDCEKVLISYPELPLQEKIATILSNYDDLIENNTKRIQLLERMAKMIYDEWFFKFKFPGHENVKIVDSKLGKIPEGWEVTTISKIFNVNKGLSYKSKNLVNNGGYAFISLKSVDRGGGFRHDGIKRYNGDFKDKHVVKNGDIIIAVTDMTQNRDIIARPARIPELNENCRLISMDLVKVNPLNGINIDWLYSFLKYSKFGIDIKEFANGANVLHLKSEPILDYKFILPPENIRLEFAEMISKIYKLLDKYQLKNKNIQETRDLLLPKLIDGVVDISELDITVPEVEA